MQKEKNSEILVNFPLGDSLSLTHTHVDDLRGY